MILSTFAPLFMLLASTTAAQPATEPLQRVDPRIYDVGLEIVLVSELEYGYLLGPRQDPLVIAPGRPNAPFPNPVVLQRPFSFTGGRLAVPFIERGAFSESDVASLQGILQMGNGPDVAMGGRFERESGQPFGSVAAVIGVDSFDGQVLRFSVQYQVQTWSSQLNELAASQVPWPAEWPEEVRDGLRPEPLIESDHELFQQIVQRVSEGRLRLVTPYVAAKELARWCADNFPTSSNGQLRGGNSVLVGMDVVGARETLRWDRGTPFDLVCVSVAVLRAAGIPARPVVGITNEDDRGTRLRGYEFVAWAEFFIPGVGWIPFDPNEMQGKALSARRIDEPFTGFGNLRRLNRRVPIGYSFIPHGYNAPQAPALWGWQATAAAGFPAQMVRLHFVSRGAPPLVP